MNLTVCHPRGPSSIRSHGGVFQGISPWLITLGQPVLIGSLATTQGMKSYHGQAKAEAKKFLNVREQRKAVGAHHGELSSSTLQNK